MNYIYHLLLQLLFFHTFAFSQYTTSTLAPKTSINNFPIVLDLNIQSKDKQWIGLNLKKTTYLKYYSQFPPNCFNHRDHASMVAEFSYLLAKELGINESDIAQLYRSAVFHDLGHKNEDISFNYTFFQFLEKHIPNYFKKDKIFSEQEISFELDNIISIIIKNNFLNYFLGKIIKDFNPDGTFKEIYINETNYIQILRQHLSKTIHFAPYNSVKLAKTSGIDLSPLEESLIRFHHTSKEAITIDKLKMLFPQLNIVEIQTLHKKLFRLLPILKTSDSLDAANSRKRAPFYNRKKETFEDTLSKLYQRIPNGDTNIECYNTVVNLLKSQNKTFLQLIYLCRRYEKKQQMSEEDIIYIQKLMNLHEKIFPLSKNIIKST